MNDLDDLQRQVGEWGERTFPHATEESILEHLKDEVEELWQSRGTGLSLREAADVALLLLHLAHRSGGSLRKEMTVKFIACQSRRWAPPDERGVSRHLPDVKEESDGQAP